MKGKSIVSSAGLGLGAMLAGPAAAEAEDIRVTNLNDSGSGSLRDALEGANLDSDSDRLVFASKLSGTINLGAPLPVVFFPVDIAGPDARKVSIDAGNFRHFIINSSADGTAISGLTLRGGHANADDGGAIVSFADLTISDSTLSGNTADQGGGAIYATFGSELLVESSTISGNAANGYGGGIYSSEADVLIRNSTISGNSAGAAGGGVAVGGFPYPAFDVRNSTVTGNEASNYGGGLAELGIYGQEIRGTIVAGNSAPTFADLDDGPWPTSFSLIGDTDGATIDNDGGNLLNVDPRLKPLKNNGGPTNTHAFKKSPVRNKGSSDSPNSDQRGAPRKGKPDIGAYELTKCKGVIVNRVGTAKKDKLKGTKKKDGILGLGGNDKLAGKKGKDGLCGGQGKDKLKGGPGKDKLDGGPGRDKEVQ
jgi:hypothetical protein